MGTCALVPIVDCGYGCYGDEFIDPAWGHRKRNKSQDDYEDEYEDEEETVSSEAENPTTNSTAEEKPTDDDWETDGHKCKIVSEDGTVEIQNCTSEEYEENIYATSPNVPLDHDVNFADTSEDARHRRHIAHRPARVHRRQEARRQLELWENDYYDSDAEEEKPSERQSHRMIEDSWEDEDEEPKRVVRRRPKHQKKHPLVVYEDDDEEANSSY